MSDGEYLTILGIALGLIWVLTIIDDQWQAEIRQENQAEDERDNEEGGL